LKNILHKHKIDEFTTKKYGNVRYEGSDKSFIQETPFRYSVSIRRVRPPGDKKFNDYQSDGIPAQVFFKNIDQIIVWNFRPNELTLKCKNTSKGKETDEEIQIIFPFRIHLLHFLERIRSSSIHIKGSEKGPVFKWTEDSTNERLTLTRGEYTENSDKVHHGIEFQNDVPASYNRFSSQYLYCTMIGTIFRK